MVYITGDMHGELKRFSDRKLKRLSEEGCANDMRRFWFYMEWFRAGKEIS